MKKRRRANLAEHVISPSECQGRLACVHLAGRPCDCVRSRAGSLLLRLRQQVPSVQLLVATVERQQLWSIVVVVVIGAYAGHAAHAANGKSKKTEEGRAHQRGDGHGHDQREAYRIFSIRWTSRETLGARNETCGRILYDWKDHRFTLPGRPCSFLTPGECVR